MSKINKMKTQIFFQVEQGGKDYQIIAEPYNITVEWSVEKTDTFRKYGDMRMLGMWCEKVLDLNFPNYKCTITDIKIIK